ncbi:MAG: hypothetical protein H7144_12195 [Burkholderiales bacterium]|nr:hypothetical protein [Phycisphaerae bacterium]
MKRFLVLTLQTVVLLALSAGIFRLCADLYSQHNTFQLNYHPDEWSKAAQIEQNLRNFNHPQLMLEAAALVIEREQTPNDTLSIVIAGRKTSAYLAALAAVFMAWAGWFAARWLGFTLAAIGAGLCPALL